MLCSTSKRRFVSERSLYPIRSSAARLRSVRSVRKSRVRATKRNCAGGRSLALLVACEITQPRVAVGPALQAVGIIVGIVSGRRYCCEHRGYKRSGSNDDLAHSIPHDAKAIWLRTSRAGMSLPARLSRRLKHCGTAAAKRSIRAAEDSPKGQPWRSPLLNSIRLRFARNIVIAPGI